MLSVRLLKKYRKAYSLLDTAHMLRIVYVYRIKYLQLSASSLRVFAGMGRSVSKPDPSGLRSLLEVPLVDELSLNLSPVVPPGPDGLAGREDRKPNHLRRHF